MAIKSINELRELGNDWSRKLPPAPTTVQVQDTVIVAIAIALNEYEKLIADLQKGYL